MAFKLDSLKTDENLEVNGVWMDYLGGSKLLIARMSNKEAEAERMKLAKKHSLQLQVEGDEATKLYEELDIKVMSEKVLLGWEGIIGEDDKEIEPTVENRLKYLTQIKDFRDDVMRFATQRDRFKEVADQEAAETLKQ